MVKTLVLALAFVVVVGVSGQSKCTPDQWEGGIGVSAYCRGLHRAYAKTSYDATNTRAASVWKTGKKSGEIRIVTIFKEGSGTRYFIRGNKCCKMTVKGKFKKFCVPTGAKDVGSFYYGLGDNKLTLEAYELSEKDKTIALAMTSGYIPVTYAIVIRRKGDDKHKGLASEAEFFNIKAGIANETVFNVPDTCGDGCGKQEALMFLIQDDSPLLLMNPFEVEDVPLPGPSRAGLQLGDKDQLKSDIFAARSREFKDSKMKFLPRLKRLSPLL